MNVSESYEGYVRVETRSTLTSGHKFSILISS